jgi:hypothetical protein
MISKIFYPIRNLKSPAIQQGFYPSKTIVPDYFTLFTAISSITLLRLFTLYTPTTFPFNIGNGKVKVVFAIDICIKLIVSYNASTT